MRSSGRWAVPTLRLIFSQSFFQQLYRFRSRLHKSRDRRLLLTKIQLQHPGGDAVVFQPIEVELLVDAFDDAAGEGRIEGLVVGVDGGVGELEGLSGGDSDVGFDVDFELVGAGAGLEIQIDPQPLIAQKGDARIGEFVLIQQICCLGSEGFAADLFDPLHDGGGLQGFVEVGFGEDDFDCGLERFGELGFESFQGDRVGFDFEGVDPQIGDRVQAPARDPHLVDFALEHLVIRGVVDPHDEVFDADKLFFQLLGDDRFAAEINRGEDRQQARKQDCKEFHRVTCPNICRLSLAIVAVKSHCPVRIRVRPWVGRS